MATQADMRQVLIVDDSATDTAQMTVLLEAEGYRTLQAGSAEQGVVLARERRPDLILMDVILPGMSGFAATRRLSRDPVLGVIPIVIVSVRDTQSDRAWGLRQGARDYLIKPLSRDQLLGAVNRHLGGVAG